jgi:hypothetical protein
MIVTIDTRLTRSAFVNGVGKVQSLARMKHEPRVYRFKNNPHLIGCYYEWSAEKGRWVRTRKSTECTDEAVAMGVVQEWARVARAVGGTGVSLTREKVLASVNHILRVAGVPELVESREWKAYAAEWLAQRSLSTFGGTARAYKFRLEAFEEWLGPKRSRAMINQFDGALLQ